MVNTLCETCRNKRDVRTAKSRFILCELSFTNHEYPKYPPQPVVQCEGYRARGEGKEHWEGEKT
jgi:hypothetical protein